jgi:fatty acid synthase
LNLKNLGQCDSALVGGFVIDIYAAIAKYFMEMKMTSLDSKCKAFDKLADGYGRSEAMVVIYLQKITAAKRIYAKIKHIKSNCDGFKEQGITFPRWDTQSTLIVETYDEAGIDPLKVQIFIYSIPLNFLYKIFGKNYVILFIFSGEIY